MSPTPLSILALSLLVSAATAQERADLVVIGNVFDAERAAADGAPSQRGFVAIRGDRIVHIGERGESAAWIGPETEVVRTQSGTIIPGFNDAHCHFTVGYALPFKCDVSAATSLEETLAIVARYALAHPNIDAIEGAGWDLADMPNGAFPSAAMLDAIVPDKPVALWSEGPHGLWMNSVAMEIAGLDASSREPPLTSFLRDERGDLTGVFIGRGLMGMAQFSPLPSLEVMRARIVDGLREATQLGVTSVHESVAPMFLPVLAELHDAGELTLRFHIWGSPASGPFGGGADQHEAFAREYGREDWITFGTLKAGIDGMPSLRTGALLEPYSDDPSTRGWVALQPDELDAMARSAGDRGLRIAMHATGDRGVRETAIAYAKNATENGIRNRIEHAFLVHPDDFAILNEAGTILSLQPAFLSIDLGKHRFYEQRFGLERCANVVPMRSLLDAGITLAFGTDFSLTPLDPRLGLFAAVTRQSFALEPEGGWFPKERIELTEAITAYTLGSAMAEGAESNKGVIAVGMLADLVVFATDIFESDASAIRDAQIAATIVGGKVVYRD